MEPTRRILAIASTEGDEFLDYKVFARAVSLAKTCQASLTLAVIVCPAAGCSQLSKASSRVQRMLENKLIESRQELNVKCGKLIAETGLKITSVVLAGKMEREIINTVIKQGYDFVLKPREKPCGTQNIMFGSADLNLMRQCPCPVLIVERSGEQQFGVIVAALALDDQAPENHLLNIRILELATWLATAGSSELHIVHAWALPFESMLRSDQSGLPTEKVDSFSEKEEQKRKRWLHKLLGDFSRKHKSSLGHLKPSIHTLEGPACLRIIEKTEELKADLIVMGTVGKIGVPGLIMGNTSETILHNTNCAVLTMKPPGFTSPLTSL